VAFILNVLKKHDAMQHKAVVFYRGALAHYTLGRDADGKLRAHLLRYDGKWENEPPPVVDLSRLLPSPEDSVNRDLVDKLCMIAERKLQPVN
jgi:hypothetical protein